MAKKKKTNPAVNAFILLCIVAIPVLFFLVDFISEKLLATAPYVLVGIIVIASTVYTAMTSGLLYDYFESDAPWYRFIPFIGELTLMDGQWTTPGLITYGIGFIFLALSQLPYSLLSSLGHSFALSFPFYATMAAFGVLVIAQIITGIGMTKLMGVLADEWEEHMDGEIGSIKSLAILSFIPIVRVIAIYAINKPLSTMVTFYEMSIDDDDDMALEVED